MSRTDSEIRFFLFEATYEILVFAFRHSLAVALIPKLVFNLNAIKPYHVTTGTVFDVKNGVLKIETPYFLFNTSHCRGF